MVNVVFWLSLLRHPYWFGSRSTEVMYTTLDGQGDQEDKTKHTGVVDSSSERSWCTDLGYVSLLIALSKFSIVLQKSTLTELGPEKLPEVKYFQKVLNRFQQTQSQMKGCHYKLLLWLVLLKTFWSFLEKKYYFDFDFFYLISVSHQNRCLF